ncbi:MAG: hypothetical protein AAF928_21040 [Myxococcota bacterium]
MTSTRPLVAALAALASTACLDVVQLRPELRSAASRRDAAALADDVETLIDEEAMTSEDREAAYEAVGRWSEKTAAYAYARASITGRLAEVKGLSASRLITEVETWARRSHALDPRFRRGAARRMLGTLYVLAPAAFVRHGDSEVGLELLEKQVALYPEDPVNTLRLAEGYVSLSDLDPAYPLVCRTRAHRDRLRPAETRVLDALVESLGGPEELDCDD